ncbi:MAG: carboxypeptidase regulatory-like domain-containing protein [Candidatus Anammoximicrobium sp.]|nr:carboxypeptidase regulatory-like domain-containing protein [Candidatus Anammoximicrobium sp.]
MFPRCLLCAMLSCLLVTSLGCGSGNPLNRQAVSGNVTLDGQPLDQGTIELVPTSSEQGVLSGGMIADGSFQVAADKGLPPGTYTVRIYSTETSAAGAAPPAGADIAPAQPAKERIPARYNSQSELKAEVKDGESNTFTFDLKSN